VIKLKDIGVCLALLLSVNAQAEEKITWKMHTAFGENIAVTGQSGTRIANWVTAMSGGEFELVAMPPGSLAGSYDYFDKVSDGSITIAYGTPGANKHRNTALNFISSIPFGPGPAEYNAWMRFGGGAELGAEIYARDDMHYIFCGMIPPETSGWFKEPIEDLAQLKGLRIRFFGIGADVMTEIGAKAITLGATDIYPALEIGTIDATEYGMPAMDRSLGLHRIAKYNYFPGWHQQTSTNEILIHKPAWDALPKKYQAMIEVACAANIAMEMADGEASQYEAMQANEADGVQNMRWTDEQLSQFEAAWLEVLEKEIESNPDSKKMWESVSEFRKNYAIWGKLAYLPFK